MASPMHGTSSSEGGSPGRPPPDSRVRYDRGIRIWGAAGQDALDASSICLLHAGPTGVEALKNLVLGGIKSFTIVDGQPVRPEDLGNNYLIDATSLGQPRAAAVTVHLKELNETVAGNYVVEEPAQLICQDPTFFHRYDIVIASQLHDWEAAALDAICRSKSIPLILVRAYGLLGSLHVSVAEHCIVESKPESIVEDLRLANPWPELARMAAETEAAAVSHEDRSHIPYALLLVRAAAQWKEAGPGSRLPESYAEKSEFKGLLLASQPTVDGVPLEEENVQEAVQNAHRVWSTSYTPPPELVRLFDDPECRNLGPDSGAFWFCVAGIERFVEGEGAGCVPLEGTIPDMHSDSARYLALQRLYRLKAEADAKLVEDHVRRLLEEANSRTKISWPYIQSVCKNARWLRVVRCPRVIAGKLPGEPLPGTSEGSSNPGTAPPGGAPRSLLREALDSEDDAVAATAAMAVALQAADRFFREHRRYAGRQPMPCEGEEPTEMTEAELARDASALAEVARSLLAEAGIRLPTNAGLEDTAAELTRWGASELHVVAALMGAIASQEAIKLLTAQFVPVEGRLLYNAVHCASLILG